MNRADAMKAIAADCKVEANGFKQDDKPHFCYLKDLNLRLGLLSGSGKHKVQFHFYSDADINATPPLIVGPWLRKLLGEKLQKEIPVPNADGEKEEGHIADFNVEIDWTKWDKLTYDEKKPVLELFEKLKKFEQENWPEKKKDFDSAISKFNKDNESIIQAYLNERKANLENKRMKGSKSNNPTTKEDVKKTAESHFPNKRQIIFFGAPGTGKSFKLKVAVEGKTDKDGKIKQIIDDDIDKCEGVFITLKDGEVDERRYERVTFYPTYSYAQFVGCYKPVMEKPADGGKEEIAYRFVPGPFLRVLVNALKAFPPKLDEMSLSQLQDYVRKLRDSDREAKDKLHISESNGKPSGEWKNTAKLIEMLKEYYKNKKHCLVIEEINRANAAAVFGDVFQLLDRQGNGESEYDVAASKDVKRYLKKEFAKDEYKCAREFLGVESNGIIELDEEGEWRNCRLRIPSNMYIWATMNSADQGVFPLDTAFKRRWEFKYFGINKGEKDCADWTIEGANYNWNDVRKIVNGLLSRHGVNEDKLMGAHFVSAMAKKVSSEAFKSKVLMYLWEDAARMCRRQMFGSIDTFSGLLKNWDSSGVKVFEKDAELKNLENDDETKEAYKELFKPAETQGSQPGSGSEPGETGAQ